MGAAAVSAAAGPGVQTESARAYESSGRYREAAAVLEGRFAERPDDYALCMELAEDYVRMARYARAKELFARAKLIDGKAAQSYIDAGYAHLQAGEDADAEREFQALIAVDTSNPAGYHHLARYYALQGRKAEAEAYYRKALELLRRDPGADRHDFLHALHHLAALVAEDGRLDEAEAMSREGVAASASAPSFRAYFLGILGGIQARRGDLAKAEDFKKRAVAACAEKGACDVNARGNIANSLAYFYAVHGRTPEAKAAADKAWENYQAARPGDRESPGVDTAISDFLNGLDDLAGVYALLGDRSRTEELYGRVVAAGPLIPLDPSVAEAATGLADLSSAKGRYDEAEGLYRQGIGIWEKKGDRAEEAKALEGLAKTYEKRGKTAEAGEARSRARELIGGS